MDNNITDLIKSTPNILGVIYQDLAQPSVKAVGNALGTVFEFSTSFLLPVKLLNEKFKLNFKKRLNEYKEKLEEIPEDKRCEVHPQIGTPIIEKLSYTTNDEIADMFTTLLANASNADMVNNAHPSFVNMIERMSPDEARILSYLKDKIDIQYCNFYGDAKDGEGYATLVDHETLLRNEIEFNYPQNLNAYLANFISLGIIIDKAGIFRIDKTIYNKIRDEVNLKKLEDALVPQTYKSITVEESYYEITDFGKLFIKACIK
ncbi:DUF4393 domain-containing protein [Prevotella nigrescens]|uniref:DUF4393 domain-containing protein n=1 Tax=Prevotella nigrescens TaxID=28133 RepID=UPI0002184345|nr:DUF4393 domain-containing protein [Prevotella nigrescens]EGQ13275.1 hypothetical protein HMPREF9419_1648 [Prevotella nigrescens ATCC 33563]UAK28679.1 DUF4393 domain-containing protein [Prevotella nigrescens]WMS22212.1 DUF4393 domain-containing protein [Prevotella nigrescens]SUB93380.1 Uncharacterised protein [Prevotella nigrescens]